MNNRFFYKKPGPPKTRINHQITASSIRLIDQNGQNLGLVNLSEALKKANEVKLDLVEIAPQSDPPVCRITDFGKYLYKQRLKEKGQKHKQKKIEVKSIRITPRIGHHDLETKAKQAEKFLNRGDRIRLEVFMRGREKAHQNIAEDKIKEFLETISIEITIEQPPKREPRGISIVITKNNETKKDETKNK